MALRIIFLFISGFFFSQIKIFEVQAAVNQCLVARVEADLLRARAEPSLTAEVTTQLLKGRVYPAQLVNLDWIEVQVNGISNYVSASFVRVLPASEPDEGCFRTRFRGMVAVPTANIRSQPSTQSSILTGMFENSLVDIEFVKGQKWLKIFSRHDGTPEGYIHQDLVTIGSILRSP
jgi:hypothetical protein